MIPYPKKVEEDKKKTMLKMKEEISMVVEIYNNTMNRYRQIKDPATKFTLLVDKLCFGIDILMASMMRLLEEEEQLDDASKVKIKSICSDLQIELNKLMEWIQSPIYGPDHPYGYQMMKDAKTSFDNST